MIKRCRGWSLTNLDLDWLFLHRKARKSITRSPFQASLHRRRSWSLPRSTTVRHSSVRSREKIETNSIYLRYTNGTRFTSPQTWCKRAQTEINQTHSKAKVPMFIYVRIFQSVAFHFCFVFSSLLAKNNLFPLEKLTNTERLRLEEWVCCRLLLWIICLRRPNEKPFTFSPVEIWIALYISFN